MEWKKNRLKYRGTCRQWDLPPSPNRCAHRLLTVDFQWNQWTKWTSRVRRAHINSRMRARYSHEFGSVAIAECVFEWKSFFGSDRLLWSVIQYMHTSIEQCTTVSIDMFIFHSLVRFVYCCLLSKNENNKFQFLADHKLCIDIRVCSS